VNQCGIVSPTESQCGIMGFSARPAGAGVNCLAAVSVNSPMFRVLGGMAMANGDV